MSDTHVQYVVFDEEIVHTVEELEAFSMYIGALHGLERPFSWETAFRREWLDAWVRSR